MVFESHAMPNMLYSGYFIPGKKKLDQKGFVGTTLLDLSKTYDCITYDFLTAKLECYEIDKIGLSLIFDYLCRCKQRTKVGWLFI